MHWGSIQRFVWLALASGWLGLPSPAETRSATPEPPTTAGLPLPGSISELLDGEKIPQPKPWRVYQASGYDRGGGFYDSGNFLRTEAEFRQVLMECDGPGVIDRMWFTYKGEFRSEPYDLLIYLDDDRQPVIRKNLDDLFTEAATPFIDPLAGLCGDPRHPARYSHVPLGFARSAKVILQPAAAPERYHYRENSRGEKIPHVYYQITYRRLPAGAPVRPFSWKLEPSEQLALAQYHAQCRRGGVPGLPEGLDKVALPMRMEIKPGETVALLERKQAGTICGLHLETDEPAALQLQFFWDDATVPAAAVPFGPFFGCGEATPRNDLRSLWLGHIQGTFYNHLPMPFHRSARLLVHSSATRTAGVTGLVNLCTRPPNPSDLHLHAHRYDYTRPTVGQDYLVLDARGEGFFAGLVMDHPGHMEGDDRFFVDGERAPSWHGTGTEDFFNFAWGLSHTRAFPLHGITQQAGGPVGYRFHLPAGVPFSESLRISWEHGDDAKRGPNLDQSRYSGIAFYYAR